MTGDRSPKYVALIDQFLSRELTADEFEREYLRGFKSEPPGMGVAEFSVLERLFTAVDAFGPDASLRPDDDLDESQLRHAAEVARTALLGGVIPTPAGAARR